MKNKIQHKDTVKSYKNFFPHFLNIRTFHKKLFNLKNVNVYISLKLNLHIFAILFNNLKLSLFKTWKWLKESGSIDPSSIKYKVHK